MNTVKLFVMHKDFRPVSTMVNESGAKYYPIRRHGEMVGPVYRTGYIFEMKKDHPIVSFLILKFDLKTLD